ncbi:reverse transcriptase (RNA-dependent DNA polymerase) [Hirsutella rhossiliensis]
MGVKRIGSVIRGTLRKIPCVSGNERLLILYLSDGEKLASYTWDFGLSSIDDDLIQYDAVNAFANAKLDDQVFMKMPPGHKKRGIVLQLQKALYGLRKSPLLWHRELTSTLTKLGFKRVPHDFEGVAPLATSDALDQPF